MVQWESAVVGITAVGEPRAVDGSPFSLVTPGSLLGGATRCARAARSCAHSSSRTGIGAPMARLIYHLPSRCRRQRERTEPLCSSSTPGIGQRSSGSLSDVFDAVELVELRARRRLFSCGRSSCSSSATCAVTASRRAATAATSGAPSSCTRCSTSRSIRECAGRIRRYGRPAATGF